MKAHIRITFDIDAAAWAEEYGLDSADAAIADIDASLTEAVRNGGLIDTIRTGWPALANLATLTADGPNIVAETQTEYTWEALSDTAKNKAVTLLAEREQQRQWDSFDVDAIREILIYTIAEHCKTPGWDTYGVGDFPGIPGIVIDGWDLENGGFLKLKGTLNRENAPGLPWTDNIDVVETGGGHGLPDIYDVDSDTAGEHGAPEHESKRIVQAVKDAMYAALTAGVAESDYRTSEEAMRERAENDDAQRYTVDGELL